MEENMDKPDHLQLLPEGLGRIFRHNTAVFRDLQKLAPALCVRAGCRLPLRLLCHSVGIGDQRLGLDDAGVPKVHLGLLLRTLTDGSGNIFAALINISPQADGEDLFMVAGGLAGDAVAKAHRDNIPLSCLLNVLRENLGGNILHGAAEPIPVQRLEDQLPILGSNVVRVALSDRKFINVRDIKLLRGLKLRVKICPPVTIGRRADEQLPVHNERGHMLHNVVYDLRPENGGGVSGETLICLGLQHQPFRSDAGAGSKIFIS